MGIHKLNKYTKTLTKSHDKLINIYCHIKQFGVIHLTTQRWFYARQLIQERDYSFRTYSKFSEKLTFQGVQNVSFSENFKCVLNE